MPLNESALSQIMKIFNHYIRRVCLCFSTTDKVDNDNNQKKLRVIGSKSMPEAILFLKEVVLI